jgi:hypothetical protein
VSSESSDSANDMDIIKHGVGDNVPSGELLVAFVDATLSKKVDAIVLARTRLCDVLGVSAVHDAAAVIAMFQLNSRVADACGIPLDTFAEKEQRQLGAELGFA